MTSEVDDISASFLAFATVKDTENGHTDTAEAQDKSSGSSVANGNGVDDPSFESDLGSALYPPILESMEVLGYIKDKNGINYSRDIGCSAKISLHNDAFFIFGDTFGKDSAGNFCS